MASYQSDIISIFGALCADLSLNLPTVLPLPDSLHQLSSCDISGERLLHKRLVEILTVDLPAYDSILLSHLADGGDTYCLLPSAFENPFRGLCELLNSHSSHSKVYKESVLAWRQISLLGKKLIAPTSSDKNEAMLQRMLDTDRNLPDTIPETPTIRLARGLVCQVLGESIPDFGTGFPCGTGAAADREMAVPLRYEDENIHYHDGCDWLGLFPPHVTKRGKKRSFNITGDESTTPQRALRPVTRITVVPKDARGPRVIGCEDNTLMMLQKHVQLGLHAMFVANPLTSGRVNVVDQKINKDLAYKGSLNGSIATLDLSEASDRVSVSLVRALVPHSWWALFRTLRSRRFSIKKEVYVAKKFAPMGSAVCFPIETLVFWALCSGAVARKRGIKIEKAAALVTVHGDDTIVPTDCYQECCDVLHHCSLKVNVDKSFSTGFFRESCGGDYYLGYDVTPVRHNNIWRKEFERKTQLLILRNSFYNRGLWETARHIELMTAMPDATTLIGKSLEFSRWTFIKSFVGGTLGFIPSNQSFGLYATIGVPIKSAIRPTDKGRYNQYWLTRSMECINTPSTYRTSFFELEEWEGAYRVTRELSKNGNLKSTKSTTYTERDQRKLRRSVVEVDLLNMNQVCALLFKVGFKTGHTKRVKRKQTPELRTHELSLNNPQVLCG